MLISLVMARAVLGGRDASRAIALVIPASRVPSSSPCSDSRYL